MLLTPNKSFQAKLIEDNFKNIFLELSYRQVQYQDTLCLYSKIPHPVFNGVIQVKTTQKQVEKIIHAVWHDYQIDNQSHCWWISERSEPQNMGNILLNLGFQKGPFNFGMHARMKDINLVQYESSRIRIEKISQVTELDDWVKPVAESFMFTPKVSTAYAKCCQNLLVSNRKLINYIAYYDQQLAGSASLFIDENSAGLYNGAVFLKFRRKGIMNRLATAMLLDTKNLGIENVITHVSSDLYHMASNFGFNEYLKLQPYFSPAVPSLLG